MDLGIYLDEARASLRSQEQRFRDAENKTGVTLAAVLALYGFSMSAAVRQPLPVPVLPLGATLAVLVTMFFAAKAMFVRDFDDAPMTWLGERMADPLDPYALPTRYRKLLEKNEKCLAKKVRQLKHAQIAAMVTVFASAITLAGAFFSAPAAGVVEAAGAEAGAGVQGVAIPRAGEYLRLLLR